MLVNLQSTEAKVKLLFVNGDGSAIFPLENCDDKRRKYYDSRTRFVYTSDRAQLRSSIREGRDLFAQDGYDGKAVLMVRWQRTL